LRRDEVSDIRQARSGKSLQEAGRPDALKNRVTTRDLAWLPAAIGLSVAAPAAAEDRTGILNDAIGNPVDFRLSGEIRIRGESLENDFRPGSGRSHTILAIRSTILAEYRTSPLRFAVEIMDSRIYGADPATPIGANDVNALEPVQAYVAADLGGVFGQRTDASLLAGRFTMDLGNRRLVARNAFRNTTNAYTGLRLDVETPHKGRVVAFYTLPVVRLPADKEALLDNSVALDRESFDLRFWGAYLTAPRIGRNLLELYYLGLKERDSPRAATRDRHLHTVGFRAHARPAPGQFDHEVEAAYQFGAISAATAAAAPRLDVSAWFVGARVGYQFDAPWRPRIAIEYDRASGDRGGGKYNRFDTLFGARRFEFGPTGIYGALGRSNMSAPGLRFEVTPDDRWDGFVSYRAAWLDSPADSFATTQLRDPTGAAGTFFGHQVEARVRYWIVPRRLQIDAGAAFLRRGRFLREAPNTNGFGDPRYGYLALTATL
jgi:hypothetical protein